MVKTEPLQVTLVGILNLGSTNGWHLWVKFREAETHGKKLHPYVHKYLAAI